MRHVRREFPGWTKPPRRGNRSCAGDQGIDYRVSISGFRLACIRLCEITPIEIPHGLKPASLAALDGKAENRALPKAILEPAILQQTTLQKIENFSETQLAEIVVAELNALKRRFRLVMFDDVVLDAGLL